MKQTPEHSLASLLDTLSAELSAFADFIGLLEKEQDILKAGSPTDLPAAVAEKDQLAEKLAALAAQRNHLLDTCGQPHDRTGIEALCAQNPDKFKPLAEEWAEIVRLAAHAKELNRVNGALISLRMQYNEQILEALSPPPATPLYGPDGQATAPGGRRINDAV